MAFCVAVARPGPSRPSIGAGGASRTTLKLPGQDSNLECQDQNLVCYQLHHRVMPQSAIRPKTRRPRIAEQGAAHGTGCHESSPQTTADPYRIKADRLYA